MHLIETKITPGWRLVYEVRAYCGEVFTIDRRPWWHSTTDPVTWNVQEFLRNNPGERCFLCQATLMTEMG